MYVKEKPGRRSESRAGHGCEAEEEVILQILWNLQIYEKKNLQNLESSDSQFRDTPRWFSNRVNWLSLSKENWFFQRKYFFQ